MNKTIKKGKSKKNKTQKKKVQRGGDRISFINQLTKFINTFYNTKISSLKNAENLLEKAKELIKIKNNVLESYSKFKSPEKTKIFKTQESKTKT